MKQTTLLSVAIAILLAVCVYLCHSTQPIKNELKETQTELSQEKAAYDELDQKFQEAVTQMEQQKGIEAELNAQTNDQEQKINQNKVNLEEVRRDKQEVRQLFQQKRPKEARVKQVKFLEKYRRNGWIK